MQYVAGESETAMKGKIIFFKFSWCHSKCIFGISLDLPRSSLIVLFFAWKIGTRVSLFNFEAVYSKYKGVIDETRGSNVTKGTIIALSRQTFLKIFIDLVNTGYLNSQNMTDVISVNNKVAINFRSKVF